MKAMEIYRKSILPLLRMFAGLFAAKLWYALYPDGISDAFCIGAALPIFLGYLTHSWEYREEKEKVAAKFATIRHYARAARGAIETDQIKDKDVHGMVNKIIDLIDGEANDYQRP